MVVSPRQPGLGAQAVPLRSGVRSRLHTGDPCWPMSRTSTRRPTGPYSPRNYDRRFHGPVRAREALASSFNLPAVALTDALTPGAVLATLQRAGFVSLDRSAEHYGLGLALGNGDVTLLELANGTARSRMAAVWRPYSWRSERHGETHPGRPVMSVAAAALVLDVLSDPVARIPGFGLDTPLDFPFPVAAKTGTSRHFTDNWAVAVTGAFTVAVWVGNFSGRPMDGVSGVSGAGPLLHRAVLATAERLRARRAAAPGGRRCRARSPSAALSGLRAGPDCPHGHRVVHAGHRPDARVRLAPERTTGTAGGIRRVAAADGGAGRVGGAAHRIRHGAKRRAAAHPVTARRRPLSRAAGRRPALRHGGASCRRRRSFGAGDLVRRWASGSRGRAGRCPPVPTWSGPSARESVRRFPWRWHRERQFPSTANSAFEHRFVPATTDEPRTCCCCTAPGATKTTSSPWHRCSSRAPPS